MKNTFFVHILGGEQLLENVGEIFLSGMRGALKKSDRFQDRFSEPFFGVFQTIFRIDSKFCFGGSFVLQTCRPKTLAIRITTICLDGDSAIASIARFRPSKVWQLCLVLQCCRAQTPQNRLL